MIKKVFKHGIVYGIGLILSQVISIILIPLYTRVLAPKDYGIIDILSIATNLTILVLTLQIVQAIFRFYHEAEMQKEKVEYISTAFWFIVIMQTIFFVVAWFFSKPLSVIVLESSNNENIIKVFLVFVWLNGIFSFLQSHLRIKLKPIVNTLSNILVMLTGTGISIICVLLLKTGVIGVFYGMVIGTLIGCLVDLKYCLEDIRIVFRFEKFIKMLRFSMPLLISSIAIFITTYIDRITVKELLSLSDVGIYGMGYRLSAIINPIVIGFQGAITPLIYANYKDEETKNELAQLFQYYVAGGLAIFLSISIFSKEILVLFTTPPYYKASMLIPFIAMTIIINNIYLFAPGLALAQKTKIIAIVNIGVAILNTSLCILMIQFFGLIGATISTLLSAIVGAFLNVKLGQKYYYIPFAWKKIIIALGGAILIITGCFFITGGFIKTIIIKLVILILSILVFLLINYKSIKQSFSYVINRK